MKTHYLTICFVLTTLAFSQKHDLGKVTVEELSQKRHPIDTSAVAAILFEKGVVKFEYSQSEGFEMITTVKAKIKIYKKEGYDWANKSIRYYVGTNNFKEKVIISSAVTYNLINDKIEKTKLKSDGEFEENVNKYWNRKKISMPNVREGSIIEYEYKFISNNFGTIDEWKFQTNIPINHSEYVTIIPEYFIFKENVKGYLLPKTVKEMVARTIQMTSKQRYTNGTSEFQTHNINLNEEKTSHTIENVPALKSEDYVNNINNYTSSISHELTMTRYPNEPFKTYSTDWESVVKTIYNSEDFGDELNKTGYFEDDIKTLITDVTSPEEKIALIYNYVRSRVKWNEYYGYSCDKGVRRSYLDKTGNSADINLMLTAMLRYAKIEANPVLVSTRSNGINIFPNRSSFNYVITAVEFQNAIVLLDATDENALPNILPLRNLNWFGRMIRKDGSSTVIELMPKMISNDVTTILATIGTDGAIDGKIREQHFDYNAYAFRDRFGNSSPESYTEYLEKKLNNSEITEYSDNGMDDLSQHVTENYTFKNTNSVELIGNKMMFSPLLFFALKENPFKQEKREYPVDFTYPIQDRFIVNITLPEGYEIESIPTSVSIPMSNKMIDVKYLISGSGNRIQLSYTKEISTSIISPEYYDELKAVYTEIIKKENEKIILKKT